jgi:formylglycine-generating enzyme required for sulfatase activity
MFCAGFRTTAATLYACEGYRLPTDAEREYAARAGTRTAFYTGDITKRDTEDCVADPLLSRIAWYCANAKGQTHPVEQLEANGWGLFDMAGNVLEWVNDGYRGQPSEGGSDPGGTLNQLMAFRITRGGIFHGPAKYCRAAWQANAPFGGRSPGMGFRLVRTLLNPR